MQATIAVAGLLVAITGLVFTGIQVFGDRGPTFSPIVIKPEASIERLTINTGEVSARGPFRYVDLAAEEIIFIGRPEQANDADWVPVEATVEVDPNASGERVAGVWEAIRPFDESGPFTWLVAILPAGSGAGDGYADLRANGPDSELVIFASEPFRTDE